LNDAEADQRSSLVLLPIDRRISWYLFVLTFVTYSYFFGGAGWNQNAHFDMTRAIVEQGSFAIDTYRENTNDLAFRDGHVYANKSPGLSIIASVPYAIGLALAQLFGLDLDDTRSLTLMLWICTVSTCGLSGASIPLMLYRFWARRFPLVPRSARAGIAMLVALGTPLFAYSTVLFVHVPSAAMMLLGFLLLQKRDPRAIFLAGLATGCAAMTNYLCFFALALFPFLLGRNLKEWVKESSIFAAGSALPLLLLAGYQAVAFGSPLATAMETQSSAFISPNAFYGILESPKLQAVWGLTFSQFRGLFYISPLLLFGVAGLWRTARQSVREIVVILGVVLAFFAFNIAFNGWHGGSAFGPRYLVPLIPLLALSLPSVVERFRTLLVLTAVPSLLANFAAAAVNPLTSRTIARPLNDYLYPLLFSGKLPERMAEGPPYAWKTMLGHVSVNRHTVDQFVPFMKHQVGSPEAEWASFNIGEVLWQGSLLSILPIFATVTIGTWLIIRVAKRSDQGVAQLSEPRTRSADVKR